MARKPLVLVRQEATDCIVPVSHKLNKDGYFRKRLNDGSIIMYHRYIYEQHHGKIPDGYEVHHICNNRACCNINHLELIEGVEHAILSNQERYAPRRQKAKEHWMRTRCKGVTLASMFGVSFSISCQWIRQWKLEGVETIPKGSRAVGVIPTQPEAQGTGCHCL